MKFTQDWLDIHKNGFDTLDFIEQIKEQKERNVKYNFKNKRNEELLNKMVNMCLYNSFYIPYCRLMDCSENSDITDIIYKETDIKIRKNYIKEGKEYDVNYYPTFGLYFIIDGKEVFFEGHKFKVIEDIKKQEIKKELIKEGEVIKKDKVIKDNTKLCKKHNPDLEEPTEYNLKVLRIKNRIKSDITEEKMLNLIKRANAMGYNYLSFSYLSLFYINQIPGRCTGTFPGFRDFKGEPTYLINYKDMWKEDGAIMVDYAYKYTNQVDTIWDYKNNKIYKI